MITLNCQLCNDEMSSIEFDLDDVVTCSNCWDSNFSNVGDEQFTFCEVCENNIERWYNDTDPERLPMWTDWKVSK